MVKDMVRDGTETRYNFGPSSGLGFRIVGGISSRRESPLANDG